MLNELYTFAEPVQVVPFSSLKWGKFTLLHTDKERDIMDQIYYELIKYKHPLEHWYYGHFHESATTNIDNIIFKMLDIEEMCELPQR